MNLRNMVTMLMVACLAMIVVLGGCKKKEQPPPPPKETAMEAMSHQAATTAEEANQAVQAQLASIEQKTCPVTGDKIDPSVFIEYKGKKVYFCCAACKSVFDKDPEKYAAKLPQFSK